jgi:hypothetical protein
MNVWKGEEIQTIVIRKEIKSLCAVGNSLASYSEVSEFEFWLLWLRFFSVYGRLPVQMVMEYL